MFKLKSASPKMAGCVQLNTPAKINKTSRTSELRTTFWGRLQGAAHAGRAAVPPETVKISVFADWRQRVQRKLPASVYRDMLSFVSRDVRQRNLRWWCQNAPANIDELVMLATCIHDILGEGFTRITEIFRSEIRLFPRTIQCKSLQ